MAEWGCTGCMPEREGEKEREREGGLLREKREMYELCEERREREIGEERTT